MTRYAVLLGREAERNIRSLETPIARRVVAALEKLARSPRPRGARKLVGRRQDYRIRVGRYRVVYSVNEATRQVRVHFIAHRRDAYR